MPPITTRLVCAYLVPVIPEHFKRGKFAVRPFEQFGSVVHGLENTTCHQTIYSRDERWPGPSMGWIGVDWTGSGRDVGLGQVFLCCWCVGLLLVQILCPHFLGHVYCILCQVHVHVQHMVYQTITKRRSRRNSGLGSVHSRHIDGWVGLHFRWVGLGDKKVTLVQL